MIDVATSGDWIGALGFRYATRCEVQTLLSRAGIDHLQGSEANRAPAQELLDLIGKTLPNYAQGAYLFPQACCTYQPGVIDLNQSPPGIHVPAAGSIHEIPAFPEVAHFLVRPIPAGELSVLSPGTHQVTLLGGIGNPGGLDVTLNASTGGVLTASYDALTPLEFIDLILTGHLPEPSFVLPGDELALWRIDYLFGEISEAITLTFAYDESLFRPSIQEENLAIYHFEDGNWERLVGEIDTGTNTITVTVTGLSPFALGAVGFCGDGLDGDDDGLVDFPADPGCQASSSVLEDPQCQDGVSNDSDGLVDFDGGQSIHGACAGGACPAGVSDPNSDGVADPDRQCVGRPYRNKEVRDCGLGFEVAFLLMPLRWLRNKRGEQQSQGRLGWVFSRCP